ncbi:MAG: hypothetical protein DDT33_01321 [Firmicutes bacterium]|nr:hypothetical protein [Bacillota bacterium]
MRYYKREWITPQGVSKAGYYKSWLNERDEGTPDIHGEMIRATENALVYKLEREPNGLPLALPALDWVKLYRKFLASRIAVILALAIFAWKTKVAGGAGAAERIRQEYDGKSFDAGSVLVENLGADTQPIKTDTGAENAYQDGRMIRLQICAAFGIPEQYFGDISTGNLATAVSAELPIIKMFESYQSIWLDTYKDICNIILDHQGVSEDERKLDFDFPAITPEEASEVAKNIAALIPVLPELVFSNEILQKALMSVGVKDANQAVEQLKNMISAQEGDVGYKLAKVLRELKRFIEKTNEK